MTGLGTTMFRLKKVRLLCRELTQDIGNLKYKRWLMPALESHINYLMKMEDAPLDEESIKLEVKEFFDNL